MFQNSLRNSYYKSLSLNNLKHDKDHTPDFTAIIWKKIQIVAFLSQRTPPFKTFD